MAGRVLIVDDEPSLRLAFKHVLERMGHEVLVAEDGYLGLRNIKENGPFDLALVDIHMPEINGVDLLKQCREIDPYLSVIIMTGRATVNTAVTSLKAGAFDYLTKPLENIHDVCGGLVQDAIQQTRARRQHRRRQTPEPSLPSSTPELPTRQAGRRVGRYTLQRRIGSGGMGEIWQAYHPGLGCRVALKLLRPGILDHDTAVQRFNREITAVTRLKHPNTIRILDGGVTDEGLHFFVMEYLEGLDMAAHIASHGPLKAADAMRFGRQICGALHEAHTQEIVHRDLKPENIFVAHHAHHSLIKLLDFGIARLAEPSNLTQVSPWIGTPAYIAPELIQGQAADVRSDIYSLGAVLYFMLTGRAPFEGNHVAALLQHHLHTTPQPPSAITANPIPAALDTVVLRCLAKTPDDRYPTAVWLDHALVRAQTAHRSALKPLETLSS
ncbi:MAG: protein kinase [Myxococcota bacterium]